MTQLTLGRVAALTLVIAQAACQIAPPAPKPTPQPAPEINFDNVDAEGAAALLAKEPNVRVLDVRTPPEYLQGHLAGAVNVDIKDPRFSESLAALDRQAHYLVHCRSGRRSTAALQELHRLGFVRVTHLDGGVLAWQAAGKPLKTPSR